jgi:integrase
MTGDLSNLKCQKAAAGGKPYSIFDGGGLYLWVTPAGGKLWRWGYRHSGKNKLMSFGKYPDVSLADARLHHAQARQLLAKGIDPMAMRKETKEKKKTVVAQVTKQTGLTFEELTWKFFEWWKTDKNVEHAKDVETRLQGDILAHVGKKLPAEITRMELVTITEAVDARGARDIAKRNLQFVRRIYEYGMNKGLLDQNTLNPAASIRPGDILSKVVEEHFTSLPIGEIPVLLRKMRDYDGSALTRLAMDLLSLTFLRTGELIGGMWSEIDWAEKLWRVPPERMKMKRPHLVPLSRHSVALLGRLRSITGDSGRLFPSAADDNGVMSNNTILKALERMGYKGRMTGHGWRSVASTYLHENGFEHEHIELQLAHSKEDRVSGAYNYAKYLKPRALMMQAWADALDQLREKGERIELVA